MIAVTGASGLLGGNLVRELLAQGQRVRALAHQDRRAFSCLDVETVTADLVVPRAFQRSPTRKKGTIAGDMVIDLVQPVT
jgi:uncharacterized protein YbjT (DUF2867 family)